MSTNHSTPRGNRSSSSIQGLVIGVALIVTVVAVGALLAPAHSMAQIQSPGSSSLVLTAHGDPTGVADEILGEPYHIPPAGTN